MIHRIRLKWNDQFNRYFFLFHFYFALQFKWKKIYFWFDTIINCVILIEWISVFSFSPWISISMFDITCDRLLLIKCHQIGYGILCLFLWLYVNWSHWAIFDWTLERWMFVGIRDSEIAVRWEIIAIEFVNNKVNEYSIDVNETIAVVQEAQESKEKERKN